MSQDTVEQTMSEESIVAPKPSDVRRSGQFNYAGRRSYGRPAGRRITAAQQLYAERVRQTKLAAVEPEVEPKVEPPKDEEVVDDDAIDIILSESMADEDSDLEEKKVDTPDPVAEEKKVDVPDLEPEAIIEDNAEEDQPADTPVVETPSAETPVAEDEELKNESGTLVVETEEPTKEEPEVPSTTTPQPRSPRAYHRPHTNQTVMAGDENTPSSEPKNEEEEEEGEEEDEDMSQTSRGNSRRRERLRRKRRDYRSSGRSSKGGRSRGIGANQIGHAVSKAFDNLLGYTDTMDDDQTYYSKGTAMMDDWQEAILQTLGCAVPDPRASMKPSNTFDDNTTVDSYQTSDRTTNSSVKHRRTKSDVSGSVFSAIEGTPFSNVLSFESTDELEDFSKDKKAKEASSKANYKVPEDYDATPPSVPGAAKKDDLYSEDLYKDIETVDLLEEGDSMVENGVKDFLNVAKTAVDGAMEFFLAPTQSEESEKATPAVAPAESASLLGTLSNVTEPLQVIKENDAESPLRKPTETPTNKEGFESFGNNVFEVAKSTNEAEIPKSDSEPVSDPGDVVIKESSSEASIFDGIENQESARTQPEDLLPPVEASQDQDESSPLEEEGGEDLANTEDATPNLAADTADIAATATAEKSTDSIAVDREETSESAPEQSIEVSIDAVVSTEEGTEADVVASPEPPVEKPEVTEPKQAAAAAPAPKKKKKNVFKKLFSRSKKDKKGKKKSSAPLASMTESKPQEVIEVPKEVTPVTPAPQSAVESEGMTLEQPDPPENDVKESSELPSCPTTPVRGPDSVPNTPKTSNLVSEDRTITKPASGANLADLPGIDESKSFREDPPASQPASSDGFGHVAGFELLEAVSDSQDISFGSFNLDLDGDGTWESFGDNSNDVGHAAFKQNHFADANNTSPQKVSAFPVY